MRNFLVFILLITLSLTARCAQLTASLVTCWPGPEVYELCGHEGLRIRGIDNDGNPVDSIWNYGVFDFNTPNFVYRFVKGETDYMLAGYPFPWFLSAYRMRGSKVMEQDLNLTPQQVEHLRKLLQTESLPQNCTYRYNYIKNNCATRIIDRIGEATGDSIIYESNTSFDNYRDGMRYYNRNYPWYQFGIDLALGSGLDKDYIPRDEMYLPLELYKHAGYARFADGRPLIKDERELNEGTDAVLPPTPWYLTPLAAGVVMLLISTGVLIYGLKQKKIARWWYAAYFALTGITGIIITFLYFFSSHEATSPNILILWLNPIQLLVPALIWVKKANPIVSGLMWLNIVIPGLMLIAWPFQPQSGNPAIFPMIMADIVLAIGWVYVNSHKKRESHNSKQHKSVSKKNVARKRKLSKR